MPMTFSQIAVGKSYSRPVLSKLWGYSSFHALARGVVTPKSDNKIILFVTEEKQAAAEQYSDKLVGTVLDWEGPNDHFAEERMVRASVSGEEIHLFHRDRHHSDFVYLGKLTMLEMDARIGSPSRFKLQLQDAK